MKFLVFVIFILCDYMCIGGNDVLSSRKYVDVNILDGDEDYIVVKEYDDSTDISTYIFISKLESEITMVKDSSQTIYYGPKECKSICMKVHDNVHLIVICVEIGFGIFARKRCQYYRKITDSWSFIEKDQYDEYLKSWNQYIDMTPVEMPSTSDGKLILNVLNTKVNDMYNINKDKFGSITTTTFTPKESVSFTSIKLPGMNDRWNISDDMHCNKVVFTKAGENMLISTESSDKNTGNEVIECMEKKGRKSWNKIEKSDYMHSLHKLMNGRRSITLDLSLRQHQHFSIKYSKYSIFDDNKIVYLPKDNVEIASIVEKNYDIENLIDDLCTCVVYIYNKLNKILKLKIVSSSGHMQIIFKYYKKYYGLWVQIDRKEFENIKFSIKNNLHNAVLCLEQFEDEKFITTVEIDKYDVANKIIKPKNKVKVTAIEGISTRPIEIKEELLCRKVTYTCSDELKLLKIDAECTATKESFCNYYMLIDSSWGKITHDGYNSAMYRLKNNIKSVELNIKSICDIDGVSKKVTFISSTGAKCTVFRPKSGYIISSVFDDNGNILKPDFTHGYCKVVYNQRDNQGYIKLKSRKLSVVGGYKFSCYYDDDGDLIEIDSDKYEFGAPLLLYNVDTSAKMKYQPMLEESSSTSETIASASSTHRVDSILSGVGSTDGDGGRDLGARPKVPSRKHKSKVDKGSMMKPNVIRVNIKSTKTTNNYDITESSTSTMTTVIYTPKDNNVFTLVYHGNDLIWEASDVPTYCYKIIVTFDDITKSILARLVLIDGEVLLHNTDGTWNTITRGEYYELVMKNYVF